MAAVRKTPARPTDSPFNLSVPFAPKTARSRAPRKQAAAKPAEAVEATEAASPVTAAPAPAKPVSPIPPPASVEQAKPRRRRLAKAFDRPLDKVLRKKSGEVVATLSQAPKATVRDGFTFPKAEHDRLVELKKQLAMQGIDVKKSDLIRVGLILALSLPQTKLKAVLAKLPPVK